MLRATSFLEVKAGGEWVERRWKMCVDQGNSGEDKGIIVRIDP